MNKKIVPTHKYISTIIFLDDDKDFLNLLKNNLVNSGGDNYKYYFLEKYTDLKQIIINNQYLKNNLPNIMSKLDNELTDSTQHESIDFDFSRFNNLIEYPNKQNEISLIFIDNNLNSELNGVEISSELSKLAIKAKRILLTGSCDSHLAIEALNNKIINFFIDKVDVHNKNPQQSLIEKIRDTIEIFINKYFIEKDYYNNNLLSSPTFKKLFNNVNNQYKIIEYYLIGKDRFLLIDSNQNKKLLICWDINKFCEYYKFHYDELDDTNNKNLEIIKSQKKIPFENKLCISHTFEDWYYCLIDR